MATVTSACPDLPLEQLALYHVVDPYLSSILVFHGPVATANATVSSSRIQAHIFTVAGFQSYPRITISPAAPLYAAVNHLPREKQGDEICRGLAVSLLKYFNELSAPVKECLVQIAKAGKPSGRIPKMFEETHVADLANRMTKIDNTAEIVRDLRDAYRERKVPWIDVDVVLPPGSIAELPPQQGHINSDEAIDDQRRDGIYGRFSSLVQAFGDPIFLPTSRLRRAPSQPTNLSRSKIFTKSQKESLRLAMCEVVDTEERYVSKVYDLVHNVVEEFQQKARAKAASSTSPNQSALEELFPPCLSEILEVNMGFLDVIRQLLEETEQTALVDLAEDTDLQSASSRALAKQGKDAMGSTAFANALLEWFPRFSKPYAEYMRAHTAFTQTLNTFLKDEKSSFSRRVYETGEQKLRSLLMEPVQRLPRYSLLIDAMTSNIPSIHPAIKPFLKARDIIKDICSLDSPVNTDHAQSLRRVMNMVEFWPPSVGPVGRLITAVDSTEILPPYRPESEDLNCSPTLVLLYKNCLVLLSKIPGSNMSARGVLSEVENQGINDQSVPQGIPQLRFVRAFELDSLRCMQSACGRILFLMPATKISAEIVQSTQMTPHALELSGTYEGRVSKFIEEIIKAKIENRFSERERESEKWTLRSPTGTSGNIGILACVFEDDPSGAMNTRTGYSNIRVVFDTPKAVRTKTMSNSTLEMIISVSSTEDEQYKVEIDAVAGASTVDTVAMDAFLSTLATRLCNLLLPLHQTQNRALTETLVYSNFDIIRQVASHIMTQTKASRSFRPPSPTKLISTLWGSGSQPKESPSLSRAFNPNPVLGDIPKITPSKRPMTPATPAIFEENTTRISIITPSNANQEDHLRLLEQTFSAYILAIRSRSGNIVGRILRSRANADKSMVNELYNVLLEDPGKLQAAAEVPVDVLFIAFETFILHAWKDEIGPILPPAVLKMVQSKFDSLFPRDFEIFFKKTLGEMSPQNRRGLAAMIRLLAELLEASGNDGDRGALTVAFAEILAENEVPMEHISLLDRLVDDFDNLFDDSVPNATSHETTPSRPLSANAGSISSNTSSFRKRFAFGLHRENSSRSDGESKVSSLIRTLSKTKNSGDSDRISLFRSRSTDTDTRLAELLRPTSRDRPTLYGAFLLDDNIPRPGSSHGNSSVLDSIDESTSNSNYTPVRRKKRRSSLSDLPPPTTPTKPLVLAPIEPLRTQPVSPKPRPQSELLFLGRPLELQNSPAPKSPTRLPHSPRSPVRITSPIRSASPLRRPASPFWPGSPIRKENFRPTLTERAINKKTDGPGSPTYERKKRSDTFSNIPQPSKLIAAYKDRPVTSHGAESLKKRDRAWSSPQKPQKLRMQSPQKLRDRLQNETRAQVSTESAFQAELELIGEEISALKLSSTQQSPSKQSVKSTSSNSPGSSAGLMTRVRNLESRFSTFCADIGSRTATLEKDLETSLIVSEKRAKKLDELYREASAENEALYERFNTELGRVVKDIQTGNGEEALKAQLREALEEVGRVKKENLRLKREVGGLKAQRAEPSLPIREDSHHDNEA